MESKKIILYFGVTNISIDNCRYKLYRVTDRLSNSSNNDNLFPISQFWYKSLYNYGILLLEALLIISCSEILNCNAFSDGSIFKRYGSAVYQTPGYL